MEASSIALKISWLPIYPTFRDMARPCKANPTPRDSHLPSTPPVGTADHHSRIVSQLQRAHHSNPRDFHSASALCPSAMAAQSSFPAMMMMKSFQQLHPLLIEPGQTYIESKTTPTFLDLHVSTQSKDARNSPHHSSVNRPSYLFSPLHQFADFTSEKPRSITSRPHRYAFDSTLLQTPSLITL
ncbi:uncharacterized protein EI90DRAFT_3082058 [Cantharellus anzutake]|uniref:uncharacterized protein n=1 Tax=Cantharellus anzutake TaxID=1750568 RepID=UPI001908AF37|nr:uncharacterized protein EI90DRAFT_3082058 [Cantharellus anzutake]KAF8319466.1 hypothetical protein EI90DRAFT_3082058 [Cantharellus anzutake]